MRPGNPAWAGDEGFQFSAGAADDGIIGPENDPLRFAWPTRTSSLLASTGNALRFPTDLKTWPDFGAAGRVASLTT